MKAAMLLLAIATATAIASATTPAAPRARTSSPCPTNGVGAVTDIVSPEVDVNSGQVYGTTKLKARDKLRTTGGGATKFCVKQKQTKCQTLRPSMLQVRPGPNVIARIDRGYVTCATTVAGVQKWSFFDVGKKKPKRVRLKMSDPVFAVGVNTKTTVVQVFSGVLEVTAHGSTKVVGPNQQVTVVSGKKPNSPKPFELVGPAAANATSLRDQAPSPSFRRPSTAGSPTLARIFKGRSMSVTVDSSNTRSQAAFTFTSNYVDFIAKNWGIRVARDLQNVSAAAQNLCSGTLDLYATPSPGALGVGAWRLPFLKDPAGVAWYLAGLDDDKFRLAIRSFLIQTLQSNVYAAYFRAVFQQNPAYGIFEPVLNGPGKPGAPSCLVR
jgi:hypothetical protein